MSNIIPRGKIIPITSGSYDDKVLYGIYETLQDIDIDQLKEEYLEIFYNERNMFEFSGHNFINWCIMKDYLKKIDAVNLYLGSDFLRPSIKSL